MAAEGAAVEAVEAAVATPVVESEVKTDDPPATTTTSPSEEEAAAAAEAEAAALAVVRAEFLKAEALRRSKRAARFGYDHAADLAAKEAEREALATKARDEREAAAAAKAEEVALAKQERAETAEKRAAEKRKRAERFNLTEEEEPATTTTAEDEESTNPFDEKPEGMPWSLYKKSLIKEKKGLVTGFNVHSEEERLKASARLAKFDPEAAAEAEAAETEKKAVFEARAKRAERFGGEGAEGGVEWARFGTMVLGPLRLQATEVYGADEGRQDGAFDPEEPHKPSEKLHIHVLAKDRQRFKKIRSEDIEGHFKAFSPTYVEWLGDVSCNVWFGDSHTAARAYYALTSALPVAPASALANEEQSYESTMGEKWRLLMAPMHKAKNDRWGKTTDSARFLVRFASGDDVLMERPKHGGGGGKQSKKNNKRQRRVVEGATFRAAVAGVAEKRKQPTAAAETADDDDGDGENLRSAARRKFGNDDDDAPAAAADPVAAVAAVVDSSSAPPEEQVA